MKTLGILLLLNAGLVFFIPKKTYHNISSFLAQNDYRSLEKYNGDTSSYLIENFVVHQKYFRNKPLNIFLKKNEVHVESYTYILDGFDGEKGGTPKCIGIYLEFYKYNEIQQKIKAKQEPAVLAVYWKNWLPSADPIRLSRKHYSFYSDSLQLYYWKQIIDSINYVRYKTVKKM
jgi:hypothetical protein